MARIIAENLVLRYPITRSIQLSLESGVGDVGGDVTTYKGRSYIQALDNVSFELNEGERLALVGHNGAGKSTLLKVLAGIYKPDEGRLFVEGTVGSVLNLALGMRPEATGRRNIMIKGLVAGQTRAQINALINDIIEFTELGPFVDQPVRTYSQGMLMRLNFAVATAFRYDNLLLDEWLGTGDAAFRAKAASRMNDFANAKTLILASHQQSLVNAICTHKLELNRGRFVSFGLNADYGNTNPLVDD